MLVFVEIPVLENHEGCSGQCSHIFLHLSCRSVAVIHLDKEIIRLILVLTVIVTNIKPFFINYFDINEINTTTHIELGKVFSLINIGDHVVKFCQLLQSKKNL